MIVTIDDLQPDLCNVIVGIMDKYLLSMTNDVYMTEHDFRLLYPKFKFDILREIMSSYYWSSMNITVNITPMEFYTLYRNIKGWCNT